MAGLADKLAEPLHATEMPVLFPEELDPFERHGRYGMYLDAELRLAGLGTAGGGTYLMLADEDGAVEQVYCLLDTDATDVDAARALLHLNLPELGCPVGTLVQYGEFEDRWDGERWITGEPRSIREP